MWKFLIDIANFYLKLLPDVSRHSLDNVKIICQMSELYWPYYFELHPQCWVMSPACWWN